jgi:hypothetical protein
MYPVGLPWTGTLYYLHINFKNKRETEALSVEKDSSSVVPVFL